MQRRPNAAGVSPRAARFNLPGGAIQTTLLMQVPYSFRGSGRYSRRFIIQSVDQLFNSSEKRLARTLLQLARYGNDKPARAVPRISQETLGEMVGTTRSRVNFFMNRFKKLGFIEYNGGLKVNPSLMTIIVHD